MRQLGVRYAKQGTGNSSPPERATSARTASSRMVAAIVLSTWCAMSCGGETAAGDENLSGSTTPSAGGSTVPGGAGRVEKGGGGASEAIAGRGAGGDSNAGGAGGTPLAAGGHSSSAAGAGGTRPGLGGDGGTVGPRDAGARTDASAATGGATPADPSSDASVPDSGGLSEGLRVSPAWASFKAFWRRLDGVVGKDGGHGYASTITTTDYDQWRLELTDILNALDAMGLLSPDELDFLREAATARLEVMKDGGYRYEMFLHRAPEFFEGRTEDSIVRLETKIDTLETLRSSCLIEPVAYRAALEQVEREALTLYVMDEFAILERPSRDTTRQLVTNEADASAPLREFEAEDLVAELERRVQVLRTQAGDAQTALAQLQLMESRLMAIKEISASVRLLLQDLERCE